MAILLVRGLPWIAVALHSMCVYRVGADIASTYPKNPEMAMGWAIFLLVDFPLGWLIPFIDLWVGRLVQQTLGAFHRDVTMDGIGFLLLGGIQYYVLVRVVIALPGWYRAAQARKKQAGGGEAARGGR